MKCPNCQAALTYDPQTNEGTIKCEYCDSTILIPESLRRRSQPGGYHVPQENWQSINQKIAGGRKIEAIKELREISGLGLKEARDIVEALEHQDRVFMGTTQVQVDLSSAAEQGAGQQVSQTARRWISCGIAAIIAITVVSIVVPLLFPGLAAYWGLPEVDRLIETQQGPAVGLPAAVESESEPPASSGIATQLLVFGEGEGNGPGFFNDTRWIGADGQGNIYTADFEGGRVQVFDANGQFIALWNSGINYTSGMAVGRDGVLYLIEARSLLRFSGQDGTPLSPIDLPDGFSLEAVTAAPDGSIYVFDHERLIQFSPAGEILKDHPGFTGAIADFKTTYDAIAVDGGGRIFILADDSVYQLTGDGRVVNRFGSKGDGPGQFRTSPTAMAVDGRGRVFLCTFTEIQIFEQGGRYLDSIKLGGVAFSMVFTTANELLVMDRNNHRVIKYRVN